MKYHLGCGSKYLDGYVNVDFPSSEHNVNNSVKADIYADVFTLNYQPCDEIRTHHMFEHFNFVKALFLLRQWTLALNLGGFLWIDVPNILGFAKALVHNGSVERDFRILRYVYGSQEAAWAYHINGWTPRSLSYALDRMGYSIGSVSEYGNPKDEFPNCGFDIKAVLLIKHGCSYLDTTIKEILALYKNGNTEFENSLHQYLCKEYDSLLAKPA